MGDGGGEDARGTGKFNRQVKGNRKILRIGVNLRKNKRNTFFYHRDTETQSFYSYTRGLYF